MPGAPAPLSAAEAAHIIGRLQAVLADHDVVMIGGSALAFWHQRLSTEPAPDVATTDLDFQGGADAARRAGELLDGRVQIPRFDDATPITGAVTFTDSRGDERLLDFLTSPFGLEAAKVASRAVPVELHLDAGRTVSLRVMHPLDCLRSRVANTALPGRHNAHSHAQLVAAIEIVPAFSRELLDSNSAVREVVQINQEVYDLATRDPRALALYVAQGIDVARAALTDDRLPTQYATENLPRLKSRLDQARAKRANRPTPLTFADAMGALPGERSFTDRAGGRDPGHGPGR